MIRRSNPFPSTKASGTIECGKENGPRGRAARSNRLAAGVRLATATGAEDVATTEVAKPAAEEQQDNQELATAVVVTEDAVVVAATDAADVTAIVSAATEATEQQQQDDEGAAISEAVHV
ncbi:MAG: hypothetical protein ACOYIR_00930 [Christensenellales bacterium]|jgi:hypothetical protein